MKKILFIRHANSPIGNYKLIDHDRPLSNQGISEAEMMSGRLLKKQIIPEKFISSSATRAHSTAEIMKNNTIISATTTTKTRFGLAMTARIIGFHLMLSCISSQIPK